MVGVYLNVCNAFNLFVWPSNFQPGHTNGLLRFRAKSPNPAERRTTPKYVTSCYGREVG